MILLVYLASLPPFAHERGDAVEGTGLQSFSVRFDQPAGVLPLLSHGAPC